METRAKIYDISELRKKQLLRHKPKQQTDIFDQEFDINDLEVDEYIVLDYYRNTTFEGKKIIMNSVRHIWVDNRVNK